MGMHCAAVCSLDTVQDGASFRSSTPASVKRVSMAIESVLEVQDVRAIKVGALGREEMVMLVAGMAARDGSPRLVVDPVMESSSGGELLDEGGIAAMRDHLIPVAGVVTPNLSEASRLLGEPVEDLEAMRSAAERIVEMGAGAALVKGGHLEGDPRDVLAIRGEKTEVMTGARLGNGDVRGTGCALASMIACGIAAGRGSAQAVRDARIRLRRAIGDSYSAGTGPRFLRFA